MYIIGIDPGVSHCGYGVISAAQNARAKALAAGVITTDPNTGLDRRLKEIYEQICGLIKEFSPDTLCLEKIYFRSNAKTALSVGQASAMALLAAANAALDIFTYSAREVKQAVTGYGSASKSQVQKMVAVQFGLEFPPNPPDAADALAICLAHVSTLNIRQAIGKVI
jgi:crossover junction endodeoxyribonuclease RuvC